MTRVERKYRKGLGLTLVVRMLHGSKDQRVLELGLDELPTYGILKDIDRTTIRSYIEYLIEQGYLLLTDGDYPVLCTTERAKDVLFNGEQVIYFGKKREKPVKKKQAGARTPNDGLYAALSALRLQIAQRESVPAFVIFTNAALQDMAAKRPQTLTEFLTVNGVGSKKAERYGKAFIDCVRKWKEENRDG